MTETNRNTAEGMAEELRQLVRALQMQDRNDLILQALGVPLLEQLRIEAARGKLSPDRTERIRNVALPDTH